MDRTELLEKLNQNLKQLNATLKKFTLALELLTRIRRFYPHIFEECITQEEVEKLTRE